MKTRSRHKPVKEPLVHLTVALTPDTAAILHGLAEEASNTMGRSMGQSSVVRALLHWIDQQPQPFTALLPFLEKDLNQGLRWGKPPHRTPHR